jgi:ACS family hexuronate transporter-like MFS transporter
MNTAISKTPGSTRQSSTTECFSEIPSWRWIVLTVFLLSNSLNFLDRQLLSALAPDLRAEFHLSNVQYGELISGFSLAYGIVVPFAGIFLDRIGLVWGSITSVVLWSSATAVTGITRTFGGLVIARTSLGVGEAGAIPSASKANAVYLPSWEWGLASAVGSIGVMIGSILAPHIAAVMSPRWGWRSVFVFSGFLGICWAILWKSTSNRYPAIFDAARTDSRRAVTILSDKRMWGIAAAYSFVMVLYMFWMGWTTLYLVQDRQLTMLVANRYFAWIPPVFGTIGGFLSGGLAFRWIRKGLPGPEARMRIAHWAGPATLLSAVVPWIASPRLAVIAIGVSLLFCMCVITSLNILPLDLFGRSTAGFTVAVLACSYALTQAAVSPLIGSVVDYWGYKAVCVVTAVFPFCGVIILDLFLVLSRKNT